MASRIMPFAYCIRWGSARIPSDFKTGALTPSRNGLLFNAGYMQPHEPRVYLSSITAEERKKHPPRLSIRPEMKHKNKINLHHNKPFLANSIFLAASPGL